MTTTHADRNGVEDRERRQRIQGYELALRDYRKAREQKRWVQAPLVNQRTLAVLGPDGKVEILPDCLTTREAAEVLEVSVRTVQAMCERGIFVEGREWRKICTQARGDLRISREAVLQERERCERVAGLSQR